MTLILCATILALTLALVWLLVEFHRWFDKRFSASALARFGYLPDGRRDRQIRR